VANYTKPGVYVQETLTPNVPITNVNATTVATFIGSADRGPTTSVTYSGSANVVGTATTITSWSQFNNLFEFGNAVTAFDSTINTTVGSTNAGVSPGKDLKYAVKSFFDNGGSQAVILRDINSNATATTLDLRDGNSITSQNSVWTFDGSTAGSITIAATSGTPFSGFEAGRVIALTGISNSSFTVLNGKNWVVSSVDAGGTYIKIPYNGTIAAPTALSISAISAGTVTTGIIGTGAANTINVGSSSSVAVNQAVTGTGIGTGATVQTITATTITTTGTGSAGQAIITVTSTAGVAVGMTITGTNVGTNSVVSSIGSGTVTASVNIQTGGLSGSNNITFGGATLQLSVVNTGSGAAAVNGNGTFYTGVVTYTAAPGSLTVGQPVTISSASTSGYNGTFTVATVGGSNFTVNGNYTTGGSTSTASGAYTQAQAYTATSPIVIQGGAQSPNRTLSISANSEGTWGNYLWTAITPSIQTGAFDLTVFYSLTATTSADLTNANVVESFQNLTTDSSKSNYVAKIITASTSSWVSVTDVGATATTLSSVTGSINTNTLSVASGVASLVVGMSVSGYSAVPAGTLITNISGTTVTLSYPLTGNITTSNPITFSPPSNVFDHPKFTSYWSTTPSSVNFSQTDYQFAWNVSKVTTGIPLGSSTPITYNAVKLGVTSSDTATYPAVTSYANSNVVTAGKVVYAASAGSLGGTSSDLTNVVLPRLDSINSPLVINYPKKTDASSVNALLTYACNRGDSFVIIDGGGSLSNSAWSATNSVTDVINNGKSYTQHLNFGAIYYPNLSVYDPAKNNNDTITIPPGGAVAAVYVNTDSSRGVYKAPAGVSAALSNVVQVPVLTNDDFSTVANSNPYVNIIRLVSGAYCVMGARTIYSITSDKYVPIRRSINYLSSALKEVTAFAVFEPNDAVLWSKVTSVVNSFLYDYWRSGGLAGATAPAAFYVKCDADNNTGTSVSNGELRIEIGVALEQPAEFVIIRIGQINGGSTVTASV